MITLPTDAALAALLDFKNILEPAAAAVFAAAGLKAFTSASNTDFQTAIPRVELMITVGEGTKQAFGQVNFMQLCATYKGTLKARALTKCDAAGKSIHGVFRAKVLYIGLALPYLINGPGMGLTMHKVHGPVTPTGMTDNFSIKDGYEFSDQSFLFDFSIAPGAFQTLSV